MSAPRLIAATLTALVTWVVLASPTVAAACSVCTAGRDEENQLSYLLTTIFMSILPLAAIGTLIFVLWRRFQKLEAEQEALREAASTPVTPVAGAVAVPLERS